MPGHKFRLSHRAMINEFSIFGLAIVYIVYGSILVLLLMLFLRSNPRGFYNFIKFFVLSMISFLIIIIVLYSIVVIITPFGRAIFSYLMVSENGLDYRLWPFLRIRCTWNDLEQIKKSFLPSKKGEILTLKKADVSGMNPLYFDVRQRKVSFIKPIPEIPLYKFDGWADGRLEAEFRKYRPDLIGI